MSGLKAIFAPRRSSVVKKLIAGVAGLEIMRSEHRLFAPVLGMYGPVKVEGNALPVFTYMVFDGKLREFIQVEVRLGLPDQMKFSAKIADPLSTDPVVSVKKQYERPFHDLASHLCRYFPFPMPERAPGVSP